MQVFHVTAQNVALKGEPPSKAMVNPVHAAETRPAKGSRAELSFDMGGVRTPFKLAGLALILGAIGWLAWPYVFAGPETLERKSTRVAQAILDRADAKVETLTATTSRDAAKTWLAAVGPKVQAYRNRWPGHDLNASALVISESKSKRRAEVIAYLAPPMAAARTGSASGDILNDSSGKAEPMALPLVWVMDSYDQWFLDAKETAKAGGY